MTSSFPPSPLDNEDLFVVNRSDRSYTINAIDIGGWLLQTELPQPCDKDQDCPSGYECVDGLCVRLTCDEENPCPDGMVCYNGFCYIECDPNNPNFCPDGNICIELPSGDHACLEYPTPCHPVDGCPDGFICINGFCYIDCDLSNGICPEGSRCVEIDGDRICLPIPFPCPDHGCPPGFYCYLDMCWEICSPTNPCPDGQTCVELPDGSGISICIGELPNPPGGGICNNDKDCPGGFYCIGGICVQRPCTAGCEPDQVCWAGFCYDRCNPSSPEPCPPGFDCVQLPTGDTICFPEGGGGGGGDLNGCLQDGDCDPGFICFNGLCIPKPCGTDVDCPDGLCVDGSCFPKCNDDDCPPGYICVEYNGNFVCMPIGEGGGGGGGGPQDCTDDDDCPAGFYCVGGYCVKKPCQIIGNSDFCDADETCWNGYCYELCDPDNPICPPGYNCVTLPNGEHICYPGIINPGPGGGDCTDDIECPIGYYCVEGICVQKPCIEGCSDSQVCHGGFCYERCDITAPEPCPDGFECIEIGDGITICFPEGGGGGGGGPIDPIDCSTDPNACPNGFACIDGLCVQKPCSEGCDPNTEVCFGGFCYSKCDPLNPNCDDGFNCIEVEIDGLTQGICYPNGGGGGGGCIGEDCGVGGGGCEQDSDCPNGFVCIDGICVQKPCILGCDPEQICHGGFCYDKCPLDGNCDDGFECITLPDGNSICMPEGEGPGGGGGNGPGGGLCDDENPCPDGLTCIDGHCVYLPCSGNPDCPGDQVCLNDFCFDLCDPNIEGGCKPGFECVNWNGIDVCLPGGEWPGGGNCINDDGCPPGFVCNGNGICVPQPCNIANPCPDGSFCWGGHCWPECSLVPCPEGFYCATVDDGDTICLPIGGNGGNIPNGCLDDSYCDEGYICIDGICHQKPCEIDDDCDDGVCLDKYCFTSCDEDNPCPEGYACVEYNGNHICLPTGGGGGGGGTNGCIYDGDCLPGYICVDGICQPKPCNGDGDCAPGFICVNGFCYKHCLDGSCPEGFTCVEFDGHLVCLPIGGGGEGNNGCKIDTDCAPEFICEDGICGPTYCTDNADCGPDGFCFNGICYQLCRPDLPCAPGFSCVEINLPDGSVISICLPIGGGGGGTGSCEDDADCQPEEKCEDDWCKPQSCINHTDCEVDEYCVNGTCYKKCDNGEVCEDGYFCIEFDNSGLEACLPTNPDPDGGGGGGNGPNLPCHPEFGCPDGYGCWFGTCYPECDLTDVLPCPPGYICTELGGGDSICVPIGECGQSFIGDGKLIFSGTNDIEQGWNASKIVFTANQRCDTQVNFGQNIIVEPGEPGGPGVPGEGGSINISIRDGFPIGTRLVFQQNTMPTGWERVLHSPQQGLRLMASASDGNQSLNGWTTVFKQHDVPLKQHNHTATSTVSGGIKEDGEHTHEFTLSTRSMGSTSRARGLVYEPDEDLDVWNKYCIEFNEAENLISDEDIVKVTESIVNFGRNGDLFVTYLEATDDYINGLIDKAECITIIQEGVARHDAIDRRTFPQEYIGKCENVICPPNSVCLYGICVAKPQYKFDDATETFVIDDADILDPDDQSPDECEYCPANTTCEDGICACVDGYFSWNGICFENGSAPSYNDAQVEGTVPFGNACQVHFTASRRAACNNSITFDNGKGHSFTVNNQGIPDNNNEIPYNININEETVYDYTVSTRCSGGTVRHYPCYDNKQSAHAANCPGRGGQHPDPGYTKGNVIRMEDLPNDNSFDDLVVYASLGTFTKINNTSGRFDPKEGSPSCDPCAGVNCTGGRYCADGKCLCPSGQEWDGSKCVLKVYNTRAGGKHTHAHDIKVSTSIGNNGVADPQIDLRLNYVDVIIGEKKY